MAVETLSAPIIHEVPAAPRRKASPLPVCCLCGLIRDEIGPSLDHERWVTPRTYRKAHGVNPADCLLTHTYCPECFTQVIESVDTEREA